MTVECMPRPIWLAIRINMQNDPRNLAPVGAFSVGIKQPQVSHQMFLIVRRQRRGGWRRVSNIGIERGLLYRHPGAQRVTSGDNICPLADALQMAQAVRLKYIL
jgi:hypothetical protein